MQDIIKLLPDSVANQIAAGEVIRRPSNVVKELVENAVDAGATRVDVIVKDAGRTLVQIVDDGCGMSPTDARMAFERHSTSKIARADDMFALRTMGFRGEALASIAAISQIDMRTMRHDDTIGTRILINGSRVEDQQPEACAPGTNIMVKNIFFNVPARRRFLRKDAAEMSQIMQEFQRMALVNPGLRLSLSHNDKPVSTLLPADFRQRISDLFGHSVGRQLLPVGTQTSLVKIDGFVGAPEFARRRNTLQYFMVNGRHMRHPYFHKAVTMCYEGMTRPDEQPSYFIRLTVDPASIDVNVHPQKEEIKFENEQAVWQIVNAAVREAVGRYGGGGDIDFSPGDIPDIPVFKPDASAPVPGVGGDASYNPFKTAGERIRRPSGDWQQLYEQFSRQKTETTRVPAPEDNDGEGRLDIGGEGRRRALQVKDRYIISPCKSGLMVVDQHRAHERILFDGIMKDLAAGPLASQRNIFPDVAELTPAQTATLEQSGGTLASLGFELSYLGDCSWSVDAVPAVAAGTPPQTLLGELADVLSDSGDADDAAGRTRRAAARALAARSSLQPGTRLTDEQADHLLTQLLLCPTPNHTDDGRPVIAVIDNDTLFRRFNQ